MRLSQPKHSTGSRPADKPVEVTDLTAELQDDLHDMLRVHQSPLTPDEALAAWSGSGYIDAIAAHVKRHNLPMDDVRSVGMAFDHPDIHASDATGCYLCKEIDNPDDLIGITGKSVANTHMLLDVAHAVFATGSPAMLWFLDQKSPFHHHTASSTGNTDHAAGRDDVLSFRVNTDDTTLTYVGMEVLSGRETTAAQGQLTFCSDSTIMCESWAEFAAQDLPSGATITVQNYYADEDATYISTFHTD